MSWRVVILLPIWIIKGVATRVEDAIAGEEIPFEYVSRTQPALDYEHD